MEHVDVTSSMARPTAGAGGRSVGQMLGLGLAGGVAAVYTGLVDPSTGGWFPTCPLRSLTGLWCPVCGMTRAAHHLFQGELLTAMRFHAFVAPIVVALAVLWVVQLRRAVGRAGPPRAWSPRWVAVAALVVVAFTVVRNLPGAGALRGVGS